MMMWSNWFFFVFLACYLLYVAVEIGLDILNLQYIDRHKNKIPDLFHGVYSEEDYVKSIEYTKTKTRFNVFGLALKTLFIFILILSGFFGAMDEWLKSFIASPFLEAVTYPFAVFAVFYLFSLPQSYYFQFVIEERFGFNRMDLKTFILDQVKAIILGLLFGIPLLMALLYIIEESGHFWWVLGFLLITGFQLFTAAIYPVLLAPLFNKFVPLKDGTLKERIENLARQVKFKMTGIFTIDGSKRSSHSNAFFAGLGSMRRIVLFDTLVEKHTEDEIVSVIAHEMGHNVKKHIQKAWCFHRS
jgi:STE24 endopeptidase